MFRAIGLGMSTIFRSGGDRGSRVGAVNYIYNSFSPGRQGTVRNHLYSTTYFLVEAQVRGTLDITSPLSGSLGMFVFECRVSGSGIFGSGGKWV